MTEVKAVDSDFLFELEELFSDGRFEEAIEKIEELDEDELTPEISISLAHALSQCSRFKDSLEVLKKISDDVSEDDLGYHIELAGAYFGLHRYHSAVKEAQKCIEIDENCVDVWILLSLIYQETGEDDKFEAAGAKVRELDEEAWENVFGDRTDELAQYNDDELETVLNHISGKFGRISRIFPLLDDNGESSPHPINVLIIPPSKEKNFYSLVSVGIGAYRGNDYRDDNSFCLHRIEMAAFLPPLLTEQEIITKFYWVARIMRQFGEMIQFEDSWLGYGHTISYGGALDESVDFDGVIFDNLTLNNSFGEICMLPCGEPVQFMQMRPLYEEEMLFKIEHGHKMLFDRINFLPKHGYAYDGITAASESAVDIINIYRPNACSDKKEKHWAIPRSGIVDLLEWDGADGCFATDRITVDKCKVGFMYREKPYTSHPDSGWRFLAGDEDEQYMADTEHTDIFRLNTICNYDPDIIEFLDSPIGSAFYRNSNGEFVSFYEKQP